MNGPPSRLFKASQGFRQGDPFFPFLLTLVAEALSAILMSKEGDLVGGIKAGRNIEAITHLQSADNTILFSLARWEELVVLKRILRCFELASRLKINLSKSMVCGCGVP